MLRSSSSSGLLAWGPLTLFALLTVLAAGCDEEKSVTADIAPLPLVESFLISPETVIEGEPIQITWEVSNVTEITIVSDDGSVGSRFSGAEARSGSLEAIPRRTATYTLTARNNPGGDLRAAVVSAVVSVVVNPGDVEEPAPTAVLAVSPTAIVRGETAELTWSTTDADAVSITANGEPLAVDEALPTSGSLEVSPQTTTTFALTATGPGGETTASVELQVEDAQPDAPRITAFTATPDTLPAEGGQVTLAWTTQNADAITLTDTLGENIDLADASPEDGSVNLNITLDTTFTLTATGPGGEDTETVQVTLEAPRPAARITSFTSDPEAALAGTEITLSFTAEDATAIVLLADDLEVQLPDNINLSGDDLPVTLERTTTFTLIASGDGGNATETLVVEAFAPVEILSFTATPDTLRALETTTLAWQTSGATRVRMEYGDGSPVDHDTLEVPSGDYSLLPFESVTVVLVATGPGGEDRASVDLTVDTSAEIELIATPDTLQRGESTTLSWVTTGVLNVLLRDDADNLIPIFDQPTSAGSVVVTPTRTTTYTLTGPGLEGDVSASVTVTVLQPPTIDTFTAEPAELVDPGSTVLAWTTTDATSVSLTRSNGEPLFTDSDAVNSSQEVSLQSTTTYTLTATGPGGVTTADLTVTVLGSVRILSFNGPDEPIPFGAEATLTWSTENATAVTLSFGEASVEVEPSGTFSTGDLAATLTYTLTAEGPGGPVSQEVTVEVAPPSVEILGFDILPDEGGIDTEATLTWTTAHADAIAITWEDDLGGTGELDLGDLNPSGGTFGVRPRRSTTYTLTASNAGGDVTAEASFTVPVAVLAFSAPDVTIRPGDEVALSFRVQGQASAALRFGEEHPVELDEEGYGTFALTDLRDDLVVELAALSAGGEEVSQTLTLHVARPRILTFNAELIDGPLELSWTTQNAQTLALSAAVEGLDPRILPLGEEQLPDGFTYDSPTVTTTYTLTATGGVETVMDALTFIIPVQVLSATPSPDPIPYNQPAALQIETRGALSLTWRVGESPETPIALDTNTQLATLNLNAVTSPGPLTLTATDPQGNTATLDVTLPIAAPRINAFAVTPESVNAGETASLSWDITGAASIAITATDVESGGMTSLDTSSSPLDIGSLTVSPDATTHYTLTATNPGGSVMATATLTVIPVQMSVQITSFTTTSTTARAEDTITLAWTTEHATDLRLLTFWGGEEVDSYQVPAGEIAAGSLEVTVLEDSTYTLIATGDNDDSDERSLSVRILGAPDQLMLSEVFYDADNGATGDNNLEWIEVYNPSSLPIQLDQVALGHGGGNFAFARIQLPTFLVEPGACVVIGGPNSTDDNANPALDVPFDLNPDLQNAGALGGRADGIALFDVPAATITATTAPFDAVVYGGNIQTGDVFTSPFGDPFTEPNAPDTAPGVSIAYRFPRHVEDFGEWIPQANPTPGRCFGLVDADFSGGFDNQLFLGRRSGPEAGGQEIGIATFNADLSAPLGVFFGAEEALCDSDSLGTYCLVPPGTGVVDLTLTWGSRSLTYPAFYSYETIDFCNIQFPTDPISAPPGDILPSVYGRVYEAGVTEADGDSGMLVMEWGYGAFGSDPAVDATWTWLTAAYNVQAGNDDEYFIEGAVAPQSAGLFSHGFRVRHIDSTIWTYCDLNGTVNNNPQGNNLFDPMNMGIINTEPQ